MSFKHIANNKHSQNNGIRSLPLSPRSGPILLYLVSTEDISGSAGWLQNDLHSPPSPTLPAELTRGCRT
jgi:hypothetical protein